MLTKKEAIRKHRGMWNWIGSMLKSGLWKSVIDGTYTFGGYTVVLISPTIADIVISLKYSYIKMVGDTDIRNNCYCCDYTLSKYDQCESGYLCPIIWSECSDPEKCTDSLYGVFRYPGVSFEEAGDIAYQIANLPEREDD